MVFDKVKFQKFVMNKRFFPYSYTSFKNKVGLTDENGDFLSESREVVLSWPYIDCVLEGGQTKEDAKCNHLSKHVSAYRSSAVHSLHSCSFFS